MEGDINYQREEIYEVIQFFKMFKSSHASSYQFTNPLEDHNYSQGLEWIDKIIELIGTLKIYKQNRQQFQILLYAMKK